MELGPSGAAQPLDTQRKAAVVPFTAHPPRDTQQRSPPQPSPPQPLPSQLLPPQPLPPPRAFSTSSSTEEPDFNAAAIKVLEARVDALSSELRTLKSDNDAIGRPTGGGRAPGSVLRMRTRPRRERDTWDEEDAEGAQNMFTYTVHTLMLSDTPLIDSLKALIFLVVQVTCIAILALGFLDASWLEVFVGQFPALGDPIWRVSFYPDTAMMPGDNVLKVNYIASCIGLMLLCVSMKAETRQTMLTILPMEHLIFFDNWAAVKRRPLKLLGGVVAMLLLQLLWIFRVLIIPAASLLGASVALASADSTTDIVLNSMGYGSQACTVHVLSCWHTFNVSCTRALCVVQVWRSRFCSRSMKCCTRHSSLRASGAHSKPPPGHRPPTAVCRIVHGPARP